MKVENLRSQQGHVEFLFSSFGCLRLDTWSDRPPGKHGHGRADRRLLRVTREKAWVKADAT